MKKITIQSFVRLCSFVVFLFMLVMTPPVFAAPVATKDSTSHAIESYRTKTYQQIIITIATTQKEIASFDKTNNAKNSGKILDGTDKPITVVKLYLFIALGFIFGNLLIFYGIIALIAWYILRLVYLRLRHR